MRKSVLQETLRISSMLVDNDISTIVFGKSRLTVEVLTRHLKERVKDRLATRDESAAIVAVICPR